MLHEGQTSEDLGEEGGLGLGEEGSMRLGEESLRLSEDNGLC